MQEKKIVRAEEIAEQIKIMEMCNEYLILRYEKGRFFNVLPHGGAHRFIEYPEHVTHPAHKLHSHWIIRVSILLIKFLHLVEKPMYWVGFSIEFFLNLLSHNEGLLGLIFKGLLGLIFRGRGIIRPQRDSKTFRSFIGHLDPRLDLDKRELDYLTNHVLNGDCNGGTNLFQVGSRYCADVCIMASKLAYENKSFIKDVVTNRWKMHFVEFFNCWNYFLNKQSTQAFIFCDKAVDAKLVVVAFRGTGPFDADDWITDFDFSWYQLGSIGKIHVGFLEAMGLLNRSTKCGPREPESENGDHDHDNAELPDEPGTEVKERPLAYYSIRKKLNALLKEHKNAKFIVTGHSLGGSLAILFPAILLQHKKTQLMEKLLAVYTFGQPRVGDTQFRNFMNRNLNKPVTRYVRMVYCNDIIPRIPYDDESLMFKHCGVCLYYSSSFKAKTLKEVPNRNFSISYFIPSMMIAMWELLQSLIMPYTKGEYFKEGWFLFFFRLIGILLPGLSAHSPVNYVNAIRLGPAIIHTEFTAGCEDSDLDGGVEHEKMTIEINGED